MDNTRKAFTLIEGLICVAIVIIIILIAIGGVHGSLVGADRSWRGQRVRVVAADTKTIPVTYIVRTSEGTEFHVLSDELSELPE
jgi:hypothetical protein